MRQSLFFNKVSRDVDTTEPSKNAQLLTRAGYIHKLMAGAYSYTPLGLKVLTNIENLIRQYMDKLGAQEVLMCTGFPSLIYPGYSETQLRGQTKALSDLLEDENIFNQIFDLEKEALKDEEIAARGNNIFILPVRNEV